MTDTFDFSTKLWQRSQRSYASTIPQQILLLKDVPTDEDTFVHWSVESDTGRVYVEFDTDDSTED